jgi:8-oxo-dGTP diphosphatase/2-hydroxy-dATP diphosphatase
MQAGNNMKMVLTLCMVIKDEEILLGKKKRGFGSGRWNGFGGKVEKEETIEESVIRELKEESNINSLNLEKVGILNFEFEENEPNVLEVHIFKVDRFSEDPQETEEMLPKWFSIKNIPYEQMWSSDIFWLPLLLTGKKFKGKFLFDRPSDAEYSAKILDKEVFEVNEL